MIKPVQSLRGKHILLADDLDFVRDGTAAILEQAGLVVQVCSSGAAVRHILTSDALRFAAVILDLYGMGASHEFTPERDIPALIEAFPQLPFLIFSVETRLARPYIEAGVQGYVVKDDQAEHLLAALHAVLVDCAIYCSPTATRNPWELLTLQERTILQLASQGCSQKEIAAQVKLTNDAVENRLRRIRGKLGPDVRNITQAVAIAMQKGLIR